MLEPGTKAPDFSLPDDRGTLVSLSEELRNGPVLVYFYPADFTPGCTREACELRDLHPDLMARGISILGISPQHSETHRRFRARYRLPFRLLADPERRVIRAYQCAGPFGFVRRTTYLVAPPGIISQALRADFRIAAHRRLAAHAARFSGSPGETPKAGA